MPQTQHLHRILLIAPAARCAALNTWVRNNRDPTGSGWFVPSLSATGAAPATYAVACWSDTDAGLRTWGLRLAAMAGISLPADWDERTRQQKKQWITSQRGTIWDAIGVWVYAWHNDADWTAEEGSLDAALAALQAAKGVTLQRVATQIG